LLSTTLRAFRETKISKMRLPNFKMRLGDFNLRLANSNHQFSTFIFTRMPQRIYMIIYVTLGDSVIYSEKLCVIIIYSLFKKSIACLQGISYKKSFKGFPDTFKHGEYIFHRRVRLYIMRRGGNIPTSFTKNSTNPDDFLFYFLCA